MSYSNNFFKKIGKFELNSFKPKNEIKLNFFLKNVQVRLGWCCSVRWAATDETTGHGKLKINKNVSPVSGGELQVFLGDRELVRGLGMAPNYRLCPFSVSKKRRKY